MNKKFVLIFVLVIILSSISILAQTYFVDVNSDSANDSNPGTINLPLKTIQRAIDLALPGDTVLVMPGVYSEHLLIKRSGNKEAGEIVIKSFEKNKAVIDGGNVPNKKLIYWHGKSDGGENKDYIIFDGFEVVNAKVWAFWIQGDYNVFKNLKVHETGGTAVQLITGSHNKFINNEIFNTGWNGISWESNNSKSGIRTDYNIIQGNYIHDLKYHVAVNGFPNEKGGYSFKYGGKNNVIRNNIIKDCLEGIYLRYEKDFLIVGNLIEGINENGIFLHYDESDKASYVANGMIVNNTIVNIGFNGVVNSNAQDVKILNNIFYNNGYTYKEKLYYSYNIYWYPITSSDNNMMNANLYYDNQGNTNLVFLYDSNKSFSELKALGFEQKGINANPYFVSPQEGDFKLSYKSPAVDAAIYLKYNENIYDLDFVKRPQGKNIDIGAYEYIPGK